MTGTHVVLGATGVVGRETTAALSGAGHSVIAASRSAARTPHAESRAVDITDRTAVTRALESADVAYLTVGLPYTVKSWRTGWPQILTNTIDACVATGTHLVYFDNVYAYGSTDEPMTESTPVRPSSRKGLVRAALLDQLERAAREQGLGYTIGRSADFYGPGATTSVFNTFAIDRIAAGKPPTWLFDSAQPHSMTYTPDIGRALALLGTDPAARGRVWHLPTAPALTGGGLPRAGFLRCAAFPHSVLNDHADRRRVLQRSQGGPGDGVPEHPAVRLRLDGVRAGVRGRPDTVRRGDPRHFRRRLRRRMHGGATAREAHDERRRQVPAPLVMQCS